MHHIRQAIRSVHPKFCTKVYHTKRPQIVYHLEHKAGEVITDSGRSGSADSRLSGSLSALAAAVLTPTAPPLTSRVVAQTSPEAKVTQTSTAVATPQPVAITVSRRVTLVPPPRYKTPPIQPPVVSGANVPLPQSPEQQLGEKLKIVNDNMNNDNDDVFQLDNQDTPEERALMPVFTGKVDEDADEWIRHFDRYCVYRNNNEEKLLASFKVLL